jgi:hypothetical protein
MMATCRSLADHLEMLGADASFLKIDLGTGSKA